MKTTFILAVMAILSVATCKAQSLNDTIYYDEDWNIINNAAEASFYRLYNAADKSDGRKPYRDYYIDGRLQGEGYIVWRNGEMLDDGPQKNYHENGKLRQTWTMKMGKMDGENYHYYENGNMEYKATYADGKRHGKCIKYDSASSVFREFNYKNGILDGKQTQYLDGEVDLEDYFVDGLMQKEIRYSDGEIRREFALVSRQDTTFIANDTWYLRADEDSLIGKRSTDKIYDFNPTIWEYAFQMFYVDLADFEYDEEHSFAGYGAISERHSKFQEFDRKGRIVKEGQYDFGEKIGKWTIYDYSQNYFCVDDYDDDDAARLYYTLDKKLFSGLITTYDNDAKIELNIKDGIRRGPYTAYHYNDGELFMKYFGNFDNDGKEDGYFHGEFEINGEWKTVDFSNYKHGVKHGEWREIKGDSIIFKNYNNGELDGDFQIRIVHSKEEYAKEKDSLWHVVTDGAYKNGKRTGHWWIVTDRRLEQNAREGDYVDGKSEGEWIFYGPYSSDGYIIEDQINAIVNFKNGNREGKAVIFKNKSNAPFKDSIDIVAHFKNNELDGTYEQHDNDGNIIVEGNNSNGDRVGEWTFKYLDEKIYKTRNYDEKNIVERFYTLDGKPYTGKHTEPYEQEYDDDPDTIVYTIKKSLTQQVEFIDSKTGKVLQTTKFKNGLPIEE